MKKLFLAAVLGVFAMTMAATSAAAQSVSGEWDASMNTPGGPRVFKIVFVQEGEKLTGTVKRSTGDVPLEGTVKGSEVKFRYMINYNGNSIAMAMTATLSGANDMKGQVDIAGQMQDEFSAKRVAGATPPDAEHR